MTTLLLKLFVKDYKNIGDKRVRNAYGLLGSFVGIVANIINSVAKILVGVLFFSVSILADGINNLTDALSSIVGLVGFKIAGKPADKKHPFGHARYEYIAGLIVALIIVIVGFQLATTSFENIFSPKTVEINYIMFAVLGGSILIKMWMMFFYKKLGKSIDSPTLSAIGSDSRNDVIATSVVLICSIITMFSGVQIDAYAGLLVSLFIMFSGFKIIQEMLNPLIGEVPNKEIIESIYKKVKQYDDVIGMHDLVVHNYGPHYYFASGHIEMDANKDCLYCHDVIDKIERDFLKDDIHIVFHYDPIVVGDERVDRYKEMVSQVLQEINSKISFHDFRVVFGQTHNNLIFDVVVSHEDKINECELQELIQSRMQQKEKNVFIVISVDRNYVDSSEK